MATRRFTIVSGPSKFDLMLGLFDGNSKKPRLVTFVILEDVLRTKTVNYQTLLSGVSREDGSGDKWMFTGQITSHQSGRPVRGFFSTRNRRGYLELL